MFTRRELTPMPKRSMLQDDPLEDFKRREIALDGITKAVHVAGRGPAVIVMTNGWSPNAMPQNAFALDPTMRELDQKLENNDAVPAGYRGDLLNGGRGEVLVVDERPAG